MELQLTLRIHVEIEVDESVDDGIKEGRPLRAAHLFISLSAGRGVTPQKLLGDTPKAFGECPAVIRL